jgi:hypothetical protein
MTLTENTIFRSASGSLFGTFRVNHIVGGQVVFSNENDFMEVFQKPKSYLDNKLAAGLLTIMDNTK